MLKGQKKATEEQIEAARDRYPSDDIEVYDDAIVSPAGDNGTWVSAWVWLPPVGEDEEGG